MATLLALVMHIAGLFLISMGPDGLFQKLTPFNLVVMFMLVLYTLPEKKASFFLFLAVAILTGFFTEMLGVHTGMLFGDYRYGQTLGPKVNGVPLLIGVNWFIVVYAAGMFAVQTRSMISRILPTHGKAAFSKWFGFSIVLDGALVATLFDWVMEPAAVRLGFWTWADGHIPALNYFSWFCISLVMLFLFRLVKLKFHPFVLNLLFIQALFFLLVR